MFSNRSPKYLCVIVTASAVLLFQPLLVCAQDPSQPPLTNSPATAPSQADFRALSDVVRDLQGQVQALKAQLKEIHARQQQSIEETRELRRQLSSVSRAPASVSSAAPSYPGLPSASASESNPISPNAAPQSSQSASDRVSKLDEDLQFIDAKINDQYQTKVESGSKYRLRLSGIVLLNLFSNRGSVDNSDFPGLAVPSAAPFETNSTVGGSLRQSQLTVSGFGPDIAQAHTSANLSFDFAGGFPDTPNGTNMGLVRLRTGTIRFDWGDTSLIAGQDALFLSPLAPTSLATIATPALSYAGNLWSWAPQVRIEHQLHLSESSALRFQFGLLDSQTADEPPLSFERYPSWGEQSGQPAFASRVSWSHRLFGRELVAGFGGYYARQTWEFSHHVDGWAGTTDLTVPIGKYFDFSGEFYRGRAVGGIGGGIDQTALFSGPFNDPASNVSGLKSMGGWTQLKFKPRPKFEVNGAFGQDNPFASQIDLFPVGANRSPYGPVIERNRSAFINFIYQPRSDLLLGLEYRRLRTFYFGDDSYAANHVNMSIGYIF